MDKRRLHPYLTQPSRAFWSRSVSRNWNPSTLVTERAPLLRAEDRIASAGSCFAANIVPYFEAVGYTYVRTEIVDSGDHYGYALYSAAYGNIYTPRQMHQLLLRALNRFRPSEDRWYDGMSIVDPFRPGLPDRAETDEEFDLITRSHLELVLAAIQQATVFIFTLGLTEAWVCKTDGTVFPACPGTVAGSFDEGLHEFVNFTVGETIEDLSKTIALLKEINPLIRVILTVSPVPLVATATNYHVVRASTYSKSVLRVACEEACHTFSDVSYFPAYEIVTGPYSEGFFEIDRRSVSQAGIQTVMDTILKNSELPSLASAERISIHERIMRGELLSKKLSERECEEAASDSQLRV